MTEPLPIDLAHHTGFLVRRTQQVHLAAWAQEVGPRLTNVQFGVLNVLHIRGEASQRELCDDLDLDRSTVAGLVARLEARGLVARVRADADRRRNVVRLTDDGLDVLRGIVSSVARVDAVLTSALTPQERETLQRLLTKILGDDRAGAPGGGSP
ncbi:MarR family winged helix-turn-helix transcriptional regulator [Cellulomonas sp. S1-8]|uniref:MarR family winged helix-turn-helix transcriptional regulator n=1 Tax=Cellulomonas sp. S1-8 TaxID=2904790 RepID=UPI0022447F10|nr:MarR family winged helix-turn-helix transcriptional regulator [Cellulomonas sp. S1-8]UZN03733.1 MarR family winged helix-turn-helix transcriptional regulator [Cellulomonas sp. S1-8]